MPLHYAVLAPLSRCYSPPGGRLPTCYSPGRHSTHPRRDFRVRLACVRHAASVDSEPGSNSQLFNPYSARRIVLLDNCPNRVSLLSVVLRPTLQNHCIFLLSFQRSSCYCDLFTSRGKQRLYQIPGVSQAPNSATGFFNDRRTLDLHFRVS